MLCLIIFHVNFEFPVCLEAEDVVEAKDQTTLAIHQKKGFLHKRIYDTLFHYQHREPRTASSMDSAWMKE